MEARLASITLAAAFATFVGVHSAQAELHWSCMEVAKESIKAGAEGDPRFRAIYEGVRDSTGEARETMRRFQGGATESQFMELTQYARGLTDTVSRPRSITPRYRRPRIAEAAPEPRVEIPKEIVNPKYGESGIKASSVRQARVESRTVVKDPAKEELPPPGRSIVMRPYFPDDDRLIITRPTHIKHVVVKELVPDSRC